MIKGQTKHPAVSHNSGKKIVLARHGQTLFNRDGLIMGRSDSPLTSDGIRMAKELARIVQAEDVQAVYCSPLGRAV
ncbi:MAG TPA: histidine phosphatase family protein, partial [Desulfomonilaceae bacterium]|nr:histidine phosphatase family protein [Desulfomonilaceae bacterium]